MCQRWSVPLSLSVCVYLPNGCIQRLAVMAMFVFQNVVEEMLFLRRWRVHRGWFSATALAVHLGEVCWQPGQDPAWYQRRTSAGCGGQYIILSVYWSSYPSVCHITVLKKPDPRSGCLTTVRQIYSCYGNRQTLTLSFV